MTLVMNQLLDSRLTEEGDEERKESTAATNEQEEETMALWNSVSLFDAEEEINVATRSQGPIKDNSLILPKIKRLQRNIKKFQNRPSADVVPEFTITSQDPRQNDTWAKPSEENMNH